MSSFLPEHVAIIMDGNGRWAKKKGKSRFFGHQAGVESIKRTVNFSIKVGLKSLTLYAFSQDNWSRPIEEVSYLMKLFMKVLSEEINNLHKNKVRLRIIGDINKFNLNFRKKIFSSEKLTNNNKKLNLNIAINYSGKWDIIQGIKKIAMQIKKGVLLPHEINEKLFYQLINSNKLEPVDLLIRTGGEYRISNFLLWQIVYSELFFTQVLWPDFDDTVFQTALNEFSRRERKFGNIKF